VWETEVEKVESISAAADRLGALTDIVAWYLKRSMMRGLSEQSDYFPTSTTLRIVTSAAEALLNEFPTGEATLFHRASQNGLIKSLTYLVWVDVGAIDFGALERDVHVSFDLKEVADSVRDELIALRRMLDAMFGWRLRQSEMRRFVEILRRSRQDERESYRLLLDGIAAGLRRTSEEGCGRKTLKEPAFQETMDRLRELRTLLQLRHRFEPSYAPITCKVAVDATVYVLPVLDDIGLAAFEHGTVHLWCSQEWREALLRLDELIDGTELLQRFDDVAQPLLEADNWKLAFILRDQQEPRRVRSVEFVDHIGRRTPVGDILNRSEYPPPRALRDRGRLCSISFWGRITYWERQRYIYDDEQRSIYDGKNVIMKYPNVPADASHTAGDPGDPVDPAPLLLASYEKWHLEELAARHGISLRTYCDREATREAFICQEFDTGTILHITTHGEGFAETWELANVKLACDGGYPARVHAFDVLARDWSQLDLVFLNSCLTSAGTHATGEQPLSLAWAFHAAGAKSVIAARWPIEDRIGFEFMRLFYGHLLSIAGSVIPDAFHFAQSRLKAMPYARNPSQWMSFVLL